MNTHKILEKKLSEYLKKTVKVRLNRNSSTMLSVLENDHRQCRLSVHRRFLVAKDEVLNAVGDFVQSQGNISFTLKEYIHSNEGLDFTSVRKKCVLQGKSWDLKSLYDEINEKYFLGKLSLSITWYGRKPLNSVRHSRTLGMYDSTHQLIKIHRLLDDERIPEYYIKFVIYHEILHYLYPPQISKSGRTEFHHRKFKQMEKKFVEYDLAVQWEANQTFWFEAHRQNCA